MNTNEAQVLATARDALVQLAQERDAEVEKNASLTRQLGAVRTRLECEKTAAEMFEKGLSPDRDFADLVDDLEKAAHEGRLPIIQEAVKMSAPNMGTKIASINHDETTGELSSSQLEQYLLVGSVG